MSEKMENGSVSPELKELKYEDVLANAKEYFKGDDLAAMVWVNKYALKDSFNRIYEASPEAMHHRIADEIAFLSPPPAPPPPPPPHPSFSPHPTHTSPTLLKRTSN